MHSVSQSLIAAVALSFANFGSASPLAAAPPLGGSYPSDGVSPAALERRLVCNADNALRALRATDKAAQATPFCRDYISIPVSTITVASTTPVTTITSTATALATVINTSLTTETSTALETSISTVTDFDIATAVSTVPGALTTQTITSTVGLPLIVGRGNIAVPTFMTQYPASRISSACSCLMLSTITTSVTFTAPTSTSTIAASATSTVNIDTTQTLSTIVTSTVESTQLTTISSTVSTTTTAPATTVTSTSVLTPTGCTGLDSFYIKASGGSIVDGQYLTGKIAYAGWSDLNVIYTSDMTQAEKFCINSQGRLIYQDNLYDNSNRVVYAFLNNGWDHEQLYFNTNGPIDACGSCYYIPFVRNNNVLTANNNGVSFSESCPYNSADTLFLSSGANSGCSTVVLTTVPV